MCFEEGEGGDAGGGAVVRTPPCTTDAYALFVVRQMAPHCDGPQDAAEAVTQALAAAGTPAAAAAVDADVSAALDANALTTTRGRALFPLICLANHDCDACCAVTEMEGADDGVPVYALTARRPIAPDEELTISYVPRAWRRRARADALTRMWGFTCACARCVAPWDDTVVLRCVACDDAGGGAAGGGRVFLGARACADCGAPARPLERTRDGDVDDDADAWEKEVEEAGAASALALDADAPPARVLGALSAAAAAVLPQHATRAPGDAALFARVNRLAAVASEAEAALRLAGDDDGAEAAAALHGRLVSAAVTAALRAAFVTPADLGIEVITDDGEGAGDA